MGLPVLRALSLCTCCRAYPGAAAGRRRRSSHPAVSAFPDNVVGSACHIVLFGDCSAFTRVAARTLAPSPICDLLHRRLQPFCYLHDCSGCFRLERLPGGACTHWKAPPWHGAHVKRSLKVATVDVAVRGFQTLSWFVGIHEASKLSLPEWGGQQQARPLPLCGHLSHP